MSVETLASAVNSGWLLTAAALVFVMQAGFALLEGGLVRSKNTVNVVMKNYIDMCFGAIGFWLVGYGLMHGINPTGWFGTTDFMPHGESDNFYAQLLFQTVFAATAATIVSGALAERIRYWSYIAVAVVISSVIYPVFASWTWNEGGWLAQLGFIDVAGSTVVHGVGAWAALAGVIFLGPRLGRFPRNDRRGGARRMADLVGADVPGHNLPMVALGVFLLWFGFFGFNGGSFALTDGGLGRVFLNTHLSGSAGVVGALVTMLVLRKPLYMTVSLNGGLAGLVAICAGVNLMEPVWAMATGFVAGMVMVYATQLLAMFKLDDTVGAVPVHGFAGAWGTVAAALFNSSDMFNLGQAGIQLVGVGACMVFVFTMSYGAFFTLNLLSRMRASTVHEQRGLDFSEHAEIGYPEFQNGLMHADERG